MTEKHTSFFQQKTGMTEPYSSSQNYGESVLEADPDALDSAPYTKETHEVWGQYKITTPYDDGVLAYRNEQDPAIEFKVQYGAEAAESFYQEKVSQAGVEEMDQQYLEKLMETVESPLDQL